MSGYSIRPLDSEADTARFDCGDAALNDYLRRYATQDVRRNVTRAFIASPLESSTRIAGFFTLSAASIQAETLPENLRKKLPRYPVPVALLGRLAVDREFQGKGLGSILLADVCRKVHAASRTLAVAGIVVDAKSPSASTFYQHFGFLELPGQTSRLILPSSGFADRG
ncbi:GNAT family N-acetyltransferase [Candidatus Symbiobacter mobilis]|uniref:Histone acetyltransferase-like protein n=1 Tax=Candidatus Symbiobacter mobilis CR TaxID=946483 RepID=U5N606_9BURK|nr:GNAT family N-acetyltransferase [Candidatus Symbiobacter mobilis]AGX86926.1 histone acetyltransferase-like protein [Candidatus Symbiobacter mobilis CR]